MMKREWKLRTFKPWEEQRKVKYAAAAVRLVTGGPSLGGLLLLTLSRMLDLLSGPKSLYKGNGRLVWCYTVAHVGRHR